MTKFYVDTMGNYLGGFDGTEPPLKAIEVLTPPYDARDKWLNDEWVASDEGKNEAIKQKIAQIEAGQLRVIREAILTNDKAALILIEADIVKERAKLK